MLSPEEIHQIQAEMPRYPTRRAVVPEALKIVQRRRRWVSDEAIGDIAAHLGLTTDEIDAIATFYNAIYREPVGRHVILICDSVSCWIMGYNPLREHLAKTLRLQLGETTADGRFTLLPVACLGACDKAPVMMVDDDLHVNLTPGTVDEVLRRYE